MLIIQLEVGWLHAALIGESGGSITDAQFPKYSIVTNFETFRITRLDGTEPEVEIALGDLSANYNSLLHCLGGLWQVDALGSTAKELSKIPLNAR